MHSSKKEANHNLFHVRIPLTEKKDNSSDKHSLKAETQSGMALGYTGRLGTSNDLK